MAAGSVTRLDLPFHSEGSTGDHVEWTSSETTNENIAVVKSVAIDDIIDHKVKRTTDFASEEASPQTHRGPRLPATSIPGASLLGGWCVLLACDLVLKWATATTKQSHSRVHSI